MKPSSEHELTLQSIKEYLADTDSEWWPFVFLRPEQHERLGTMRCAVLALLQGVPVGLLAMIVGKLMGDPVQTLHLATFPIYVFIALFLTYKLGIARFWNERAARLRPLHARRERWQRALLDE